MKLTTHLHLMPWLRMRGAIRPLPQYSFTAQYLVKHKNDFTFTRDQLGYTTLYQLGLDTAALL